MGLWARRKEEGGVLLYRHTLLAVLSYGLLVYMAVVLVSVSPINQSY